MTLSHLISPPEPESRGAQPAGSGHGKGEILKAQEQAQTKE